MKNKHRAPVRRRSSPHQMIAPAAVAAVAILADTAAKEIPRVPAADTFTLELVPRTERGPILSGLEFYEQQTPASAQ